MDLSINQGDNSFFPSLGLKNCPTAMDTAGGGLPETDWDTKLSPNMQNETNIQLQRTQKKKIQIRIVSLKRKRILNEKINSI